MTIDIKEMSESDLKQKIENIKAERERTANALKRYEEELESRKKEVPLGVPQESIAQDSIPMQKMNRDCEIGTLGKYVVMMSLADLKEIANGELRAYSEELEHENSALQAKLDKAVEALKFYANADVYEYYDKYESTAIQHDGGEWAQKVLKEIEE